MLLIMDDMAKKRRFLNTRPKDQNQRFSELVTQSGGEVVEFPTIEIVALDDWRQALTDPVSCDIAIFTSPNAVIHFFQALFSLKQSWPVNISTYAIGHATKKRLNSYGVQVQAIPKTLNSEGLIEILSSNCLQDQKVLIIKGDGGRSRLKQELSKKGAMVQTFNVYTRTIPAFSQKRLKAIWQQQQVDIILFTSQTSIMHLKKMMGHKGWAWAKMQTALVISHRIALKVKALGFDQVMKKGYLFLAASCKYMQRQSLMITTCLHVFCYEYDIKLIAMMK